MTRHLGDRRPEFSKYEGIYPLEDDDYIVVNAPGIELAIAPLNKCLIFLH